MTKKLFILAIFILAATAATNSKSYAQTVTRLTFNTGTDIFPAWDPRGNTIAYIRSKTPSGSVYDAYAVNANGTGAERILQSGLNQDFGVAVALSWIGTTGFLADEEAISGFEILKFNTSFAPFNRTTTNGPDAANSVLLNIDGGGGGSLTKISRDGLKALIRFSSNGSSGDISIRTGPVSSMTGGLSSTFGKPLISVNAGDSRFLNGGAISPDGSRFVISFPVTTASSGHDLVLGSTTGEFANINLTNNGVSGFLNEFPDFSPDGTKIAFARKDSNPNSSFDLYTINVDGSGLTQITNTPNFAENYPSWSPDGTKIAFHGMHVAGHESEFPALQPGESANWNIYTIALAAPAKVVTPKTKLIAPPVITVRRANATFTFVRFSRAQLAAVKKMEERAKAKVSFKYELVLTPADKKRARITRISAKNSVTVKNLPAGNYNAKYRVQITSKAPSSPPVIKNTTFSPRGTFFVS